MELEVGMYVRFNDEDFLFEGRKITKINNLQWFEMNKNLIAKASHNIIDLIEVGDVLVDKEGYKYPINYEFETDYNSEYGSYEITIDDNITLFFKDGLSIVTKEQFESMEYRVGE